MTLKQYLIYMTLATLFCWLIWFGIVWTINPELTNWIGFAMFYAALFLSLVGTAAVLGFLVRFVALRKELAYYLVKEAFRQSFLLASLIIISLMLLSKGLFSWLNLILLIVGLSALEYFLLSYKKVE